MFDSPHSFLCLIQLKSKKIFLQDIYLHYNTYVGITKIKDKLSLHKQEHQFIFASFRRLILRTPSFCFYCVT